MGILQVVLADFIASNGVWVAVPFVFGSWMNAQIFLFLALTDDSCANQPWFRIVTITSFVCLTFAYLALIVFRLA